MKIEVNGLQQEFSTGTNLVELLSQLSIMPERVAIELNLSVIDRKQFDQVSLKEGDKIEIINFVGGGGGAAP